MRRDREPWEWMLLGGLALLVVGVLALGGFLVGKETWRFQVGAEIAAPPAQVFDWLARREKRLAWEPDLIDVAPLTGTAGTAGSTELLYLRRDGDRWQVEERLRKVLPSRRLEVERLRDGQSARIAITITPTSQGSRIVWRELRSYENWQERFLAPLEIMERRSRLKAGLARLALLAEKE